MSRIVDLARRFASERGLHNGDVPVELAILHDEFQVIYADLSQERVLGYAMFPPSGVVSRAFPARVYIDEGLDRRDRGYVFAHELGHYIAGHLMSARTTELCPDTGDAQEREAWTAAAAVLIPPYAIQYLDEGTIDELASICQVPVWMAERYVKLEYAVR